MDSDLVTIAEQLLRERYVPGRHAVAAALRTHDGRIFTGLHIGGNVARVSLCAEAAALSQAIMNVSHDLDTIVALHHTSVPGTDFACKVVSPCGMCRELLSDYAPDLRVILPTDRGEPMTVPIADLLPYKFVRPRPEAPPP